MTRRPARLPLVLLLAAGVVAAAACGLGEKVGALVARPTPAPAATPTPLPVPPLQMEFVRVREERARGAGGTPSCEVEIELSGAKRSEIEAYRVVVRVAVDDLGSNLVPAAVAELAPLPEGPPDAPILLPVPLGVAPRRATSLREVSGELQLYVPGADSSAPRPAPGTRHLTPNTLRRYRFALKDVPLP